MRWQVSNYFILFSAMIYFLPFVNFLLIHKNYFFYFTQCMNIGYDNEQNISKISNLNFWCPTNAPPHPHPQGRINIFWGPRLIFIWVPLIITTERNSFLFQFIFTDIVASWLTHVVLKKIHKHFTYFN